MKNKGAKITLIIILVILVIALINFMIYAMVNKNGEFKLSLIGFGDNTAMIFEKEYNPEELNNINVDVSSSDVKIENQELRRKVIELENKLKATGDSSQLREEYEAYIKQSKDQILSLKERNPELLLENQELAARLNSASAPSPKMQWDADEEQNKAIERLIQNLKTAYKRQNGTEEALSQLAAIIDPECVVSRDKPAPSPSPAVR